MILLRRLNGSELGVNADLIERIEANPDTVLTLVDGTKYLVAESPSDVVNLIVSFRARILASAQRMDLDGEVDDIAPLRLVAEIGDDL